jgi:copper chaperone NosL
MNSTELTKSGIIAAGLIACILMIAGCQKPPVMPVGISSDDVCDLCKSTIAQPDFAAEFLTKSGSLRKFDDMACLIASAQAIGKEQIQSTYVMDHKSVTLTPAEQAYFVRSDKIRTPKNGGLIAFKDLSEAQSLASRYQAEMVKFSDLVK